MLKVTLHNSKPSRASDRNVLGRLDIGYAKLDARADYKAVMFIAGVGEQQPVQLLDYPPLVRQRLGPGDPCHLPDLER